MTIPSLKELKGGHLDKVTALRDEIAKVHYHVDKRSRFAMLINKADDEVKYLLTFACWICLKNRNLPTIKDVSRFYSIPSSDETSVTVQDFADFMRANDRRVITRKRETQFLTFLSQCTVPHQDFYLSLLSKSFVKGLPLTAIQEFLDLSLVDPRTIYDKPLPVMATFAELTYPVAVVSIVDDSLPEMVLIRSNLMKTGLLKNDDGTWKRSKKFTTADVKWVNLPTTAIYGRVKIHPNGRKEFFPTDMFKSYLEFRKYVNGKQVTPWIDRVTKLDSLLQRNFFPEIKPHFAGVAFCEADLIRELFKAVEGSPYSWVSITDSNTARTGTSYTVKAVRTQGIIADLWVEDEEAKGFVTWFNGVKHNVPYSFKGKEGALLNDPKLANQKLLNLLRVVIGDRELIVGVSIAWHQRPWRRYRMWHSEIRLEKCIFCGGTEQRPVGGGVCVSCEKNIVLMYKSYGRVGKWAKAQASTQAKRAASGWDASMFRTIGYTYKGMPIDMLDDGRWRFVPEEEMDEYFIRNAVPTDNGEHTAKD